jgi:5'-3' exonuclease
MGIPMYAKTVTRKYPSIIDPTMPKCTRLFLDLNCAIHQSANSILQMNQNITKESLEKDIVNHTIDYILKIMSYTSPTDVVFIAIDGIPPQAKIAQQRKRRFVSSWRTSLINTKRKETNVTYTEWDTNAITPGTEFMNFLSKSLHNYFDNGSFKQNIILSDSNEPGEGEAKILDYIKDNDVPANADIIYGLDADLIMLSLLSSRNNIYLLREPVHFDMKVPVPKPFLLLNIQLLRKYISIEYNSKSLNEVDKDYFDENICWDYVALCFILGNDFLPPLSFLKIKFNGIDLLMQCYNKVKEELQQTFVVKTKQAENTYERGHYCINYLFLLKLLEKLKNMEDECMCEAEDNYYSRGPPPFIGKKSAIEKISNEIDNYPSFNKFPNKINPHKTGWRLNYYHYLFNVTEIQDINDVCLNYLEGLEWTINYYFNRCVSYEWYYKYNYSPTILDLYNYLLINLSNTDTFLINSIKTNYPKVEYDTDLQLLLVLPPSSINLLKPKLRPILTDISLGCMHYYPIKFKISTYLKMYLWECSPNLPPIDIEKVRKTKNLLISE